MFLSVFVILVMESSDWVVHLVSGSQKVSPGDGTRCIFVVLLFGRFFYCVQFLVCAFSHKNCKKRLFSAGLGRSLQIVCCCILGHRLC